MKDPSSPDSHIQRGWTTEARTSMGWREHTLKYYAKINPTRIIQCCLTSKGYKGFAPADLRMFYDAKIFRGGEIMQILLMQWYVMTFTWNFYNSYVIHS